MKTYDQILEELCQELYKMTFIECCDKIVYKALKTLAKRASEQYAVQSIESDRRKVVDFMIDSRIDKTDITTSDIINLPIILS